MRPYRPFRPNSEWLWHAVLIAMSGAAMVLIWLGVSVVGRACALLGGIYGFGCVLTMGLVFWNWARRSVPDEGRSPFFAAWIAVLWPITLWFVIFAATRKD